MLDIKLIRTKSEEIKALLSKRKAELVANIDEILNIDLKKRDLQQKTDELKAQRNALSKSIKSKEEADSIRSKVTEINEEISQLNNDLEASEIAIENLLLSTPNVPHKDVPEGKDESENKVLKQVGDKPNINKPLAHWEVAEKLNLVDFENTTRICGSRFSTYFGQGARLQRAIIQFFLDEASSNGYTEVSPPAIIGAEALKGTGQLPKFEEDLYKIEGQNQYLIPTAEVPLTSLFANGKALSNEEVSKRLCAYTPCFRSEAGAAGKDTRGLIRQHQFDKVELVHICKPEESEAEHERLVNHAEGLLEKLGLSYKRVLLCTGDMGFSAAKCYDLEVWFPSQNTYREISSCSNCWDFQARRLNLKFKRDAKSKPEFLHTLNGSGLAVGRTFAAILENYQIEDGSKIVVPQALQKYLNNQEFISL
ncbi:MAG TPA: serine--tRNA ligase [Vampirovibrionales bacterium]